MSVSLLVVGLGNLPLPKTRHSVGHLVVDALAARLAIRMAPSRALDGLAGHALVTLADTTVHLALFKPRPLMNITGPAVAAARRRFPGALVVIHDSLQHRPTVLSPKFGGSANGHNGVRSVMAALGHPNFHRLRIGIGRDGDAASYVLARLPPDECDYWHLGAGLDLVCAELAKIARNPPPS